MKIQTKKLTGAALNWAVGILRGWVTYPTGSKAQGKWFHTDPSITSHEQAPAQADDFGSAEHWKEKAQYWAGVAHRLRGEALRGEPVDGIIHPPMPSPQAAQQAPAGATDPWQQHMANQAEVIDCEALKRAMVQHGISFPEVGMEYFRASLGEMVNRFERFAAPAAPRTPASGGWISVGERLPEPGTPVLLDIGLRHPIRAMWTEKHSVEAADDDTDWGEYVEEHDMYYAPEGWYEWNQNEETHWKVAETPRAWRPLPASPTIEGESK